MGGKDRKEKEKGEAKVEGPQGFAEMCREMMSGGMPDCCGSEMQGMMSRMMSTFQLKEGK